MESKICFQSFTLLFEILSSSQWRDRNFIRKFDILTSDSELEENTICLNIFPFKFSSDFAASGVK